MFQRQDVRDLPIPYRLKEARLRSGLTQELLGIKAGIDEYSASTRMNQYEKGVHVPNYELLERCATILDVPVEYFYTRSDQNAKLLLRFHCMTDKQKANFLEHIMIIDESRNPAFPEPNISD